MKKILFLAVSAILLAASCQKTEIINQAPGESLTFAPYLGKLTKAANEAELKDGEVHLKSQNFYVWAYADFEDELNGKADLDLIYDNMNGVEVKFENSAWGTNLDYYWPGQNKKLNFFAVSGISQEDASGTVVNIKINRDASDKTKINPTLTINEFTANGQTDLMVADFVNQAQNNDKTPTKSVNLKFRHTLSKVQFLFKTEESQSNSTEGNDVVLVQHITVENVKTTSKLLVDANTDATTSTTKPYKAKWDEPADGSNKVDLTEGYDGQELPNKAATTDFPSDIQWIDNTKQDLTAMKLTKDATPFATWLLMPQTIYDNDTQLTVKVLYLMGKRQMESVFVLNAENFSRWNENQYIRYIITLTPNKITFVPSVEDWEEKEVGMGN